MLCALQEGQDAAVNNPGSAYGASPLGPSAGSAAGTSPATSNGEAGTRPEAMPSQPHEDGNGVEQASDEGEANEQPGLALPFEPVALVFRDIHYYVKQGGGDLELLKVSVPVCLLCCLPIVPCPVAPPKALVQLPLAWCLCNCTSPMSLCSALL